MRQRAICRCIHMLAKTNCSRPGNELGRCSRRPSGMKAPMHMIASSPARQANLACAATTARAFAASESTFARLGQQKQNIVGKSILSEEKAQARSAKPKDFYFPVPPKIEWLDLSAGARNKRLFLFFLRREDSPFNVLVAFHFHITGAWLCVDSDDYVRIYPPISLQARSLTKPVLAIPRARLSALSLNVRSAI